MAKRKGMTSEERREDEAFWRRVAARIRENEAWLEAQRTQLERRRRRLQRLTFGLLPRS